MIGGLVRLVLVLVIVAAVGAYFLGYRFHGGTLVAPGGAPVTSGSQLPEVDTSRARDTGAAIGEKVATSANEAQRALGEMALQGKIKSKMALDDLVKASDIDIDSLNGVVTLTGTVRSEAERTRALRIARETDGVTSVTDRLTVR